MAEPAFRDDLYLGTAADYERFRLPYPRAMIDDLASRIAATGDGRLLDLGCGNGMITFALRDRFAETWAVDQEPDMVNLVREKAKAAQAADVTAVLSSAELLAAPAAHFDLVAIGNAFHRLPRDTVAPLAFGWTRPGGFLALLWGATPWQGEGVPWLDALAATMHTWQVRAGATERLPRNWDEPLQQRPNPVVLADAGFEVVGKYEFTVTHEWTAGGVIGFLYSTSILSRHALGDLAEPFAEDVRAVLPAGRFSQQIEYSYDLARRAAT
jgi:SAM-dependent methyltransferase